MSKVYKNKILTTAGFDLPAATPLDDRLVVQTIEDLTTELVNKNVAYEGMRVYVTAEKLDYQYIDGVWVKSTSGVPLIPTTYENSMKTPEFEDGTQNVAVGKATTAIGYGTKAGLLAWRIAGVNFDGTEIVVYDPYTTLTEDAVGLSFGVRLSDVYEYCGAVQSVYRLAVNPEYAAITVEQPLPETLVAEAQQGMSVGKDDWVSDKDSLKIYDMPFSGNIPTGGYSLSEGHTTHAQGMCSHAEGYNTRASGKYSHAEGQGSIAAHDCHAEGYCTKALGLHAHSQGNQTIAQGDTAHAEGEVTRAIGNCSHAEGKSTQALGYASHAQGNGSIASGNAASAAGEFTYATSTAQFVHGRYNVVDENGSAGNYAHIVGGGTSNASRKNIYTLDWNGNAVFAGTVTNAQGKTLTTHDFTGSHKDKLDSLPAQGTGDIAGQIAFGASCSATGKGAFAEGHNCHAKAWASHAEGNGTQTLAGESHAEGRETSAEAVGAHAEGIGTRATVDAQHAEGMYNIAGNYAHVVGNGKSSDERSNAYTLDWQGNAWFAGSIRCANDNSLTLSSSDTEVGYTQMSGGYLKLASDGDDGQINIDRHGISLRDTAYEPVFTVDTEEGLFCYKGIHCLGEGSFDDLYVGPDDNISINKDGIHAHNNTVYTSCIKLSGEAINHEIPGVTVEADTQYTYVGAGEIELGSDVYINSSTLCVHDIRLDGASNSISAKTLNISDEIVCEATEGRVTCTEIKDNCVSVLDHEHQQSVIISSDKITLSQGNKSLELTYELLEEMISFFTATEMV